MSNNMHKIQFRGKRTDSGEVVFGDLIHNPVFADGSEGRLGIKPERRYVVEVNPHSVTCEIEDRIARRLERELVVKDKLLTSYQNARGQILTMSYQKRISECSERIETLQWVLDGAVDKELKIEGADEL